MAAADPASRDRALAEVRALAGRLRAGVAPQPLTVGFSGGADSTLALLVAIALREQDARYAVRAVHCVHGLDASDPLWLAHCRQLCRTLEAELLTPRLHISHPPGTSLEEESRRERYRALLRHRLPPGCLVLGHQADDQAETLLLALRRGSGPQGLSGMQELTRDRRGLICRPLLGLRKSEIMDLLTALGLTWVTDESNASLSFERNFLRLRVMPLLESRFPGMVGSLLRTGQLCALEHDLAVRYVQERAERHIAGRVLDFAGVDLEDEHLCLMLLREFLLRLGGQPPGYQLVRSLYELMRGSPDQHAQFSFQGLVLRRYRLTLMAEVPRTLSVPVPRVQLGWGEQVVLGDYVYALEECGDEERMRGFELRPGERLTLCFDCPGSMLLQVRSRPRRRSLRKLLAEHRIPPHLRRLQPLVLGGDGSILALGEVAATVLPPRGLPPGRCVRLRIRPLVPDADDEGMQVQETRSGPGREEGGQGPNKSLTDQAVPQAKSGII